jgi:hypothetical protein
MDRSILTKDGSITVQMENTRLAARRLAKEKKIQILQKGNVLDPDSQIKGPIRLKIVSSADLDSSSKG